MATRNSIKSKNKTKLGAAASLAAGGVALGVDAGASSDPLGTHGHALLESAFRLLEEGQNQFLASEDVQTQEIKRFKPEVIATGSEATAEPQIQLPATAEPLASDVVIAQASGADLVLAQSSTPATAPNTAVESVANTANTAATGNVAPPPANTVITEAGSTSVSTGASSAAATPVGAVQAAAAAVAETGAAAIVGFTPLATALGVGAVAAVADAASSTGGSDLNNDQDGNVLNDSARLFSISGESVNSNEAPAPAAASGAGLIGGTNFIDDSTNSFFA